MSSNGVGVDFMNGTPRPKVGMEQGTIFDYNAGDLIFAEIPGVPDNGGLVYEWRTPTIAQMREMLDRDGRARSLEQCLVMPITGASYQIDGQDQEIADWVDNALRASTLDGGMSTPMNDVIAQKAEALIFRTSFHEKVWKLTDDNKVTYDKLAWRPPDTCELIRDKTQGDLMGFAQWVLGKTQQVPILLPYADIFIHGARRDPNRGISDLTVTYHNYRIKEKLKYLWYTYCEVLSLPRQVILSDDEPNGKKAANAIAGLKNAGVAGIPASWVKSIETISVAGNGTADFLDAIGYLDSDSALSLLAGFSELPSRAMGTGSSHGPLGSYALAESAQSFFVDMLESYAVEMNTQITNSVVADLVRYNFGTKAKIPTFTLDLEEEQLSKSYDLMGRLLTSPTPTNVPAAFVKELVLSVAKQLGMDVNAISKAIDAQAAVNTSGATTPQMAENSLLHAATDVGAVVAGNGQAILRNQPPAPANA